MLKKRIMISAITFAVSVAFIFFLFRITHENNHSFNSFTRLFPAHVAKPLEEFDLKYNSYYIAGGWEDKVYMGNSTSPLRMLTIDLNRRDTNHLTLKINKLERFASMEIAVDSPFFYATDGVLPAIFRGTLKSLEAYPYPHDSTYFVDAEPINNNSFALRSIAPLTTTSILIKESIDSPRLNIRQDIIEKQVDGMFCTDGMLHYNRTLQNIVYLYRYRNQFICMDTSLNVLYKGNTIDTISHARITVDRKTDGSYTMSTPPLTVNNVSCTSGKWLFVNSNLLAKNEDTEVFDNTSVIDVYDLRTGRYKFSFYLDKRGNEKMRSFKVFNNTLIAMHGQYALVYSLEPGYFQD